MLYKRFVLVTVLIASLNFTFNPLPSDRHGGVGVLNTDQLTSHISSDSAETLSDRALRFFDVELREDDTTALTDHITNLSYYSTFTYYGPSDVEWLDLAGGTSYDIQGTNVVFHEVQGEVSITFRSREFSSRQGEIVTMFAQPWATFSFDIEINFFHPPWYSLVSVEPPGHTSNIGVIHWSFVDITLVELQANFDHAGPLRPMLDLPVDYQGRNENSGINFAKAFNKRVTSLFDHRFPDNTKDNKFLPYTGTEMDDPFDDRCQHSVNCYDGHDAYDFDDLCTKQAPCTDPTAVYPAADGEIVQAGWLDSILGCQIEIDHENGWTTLYAHLRDSQNDRTCDGIYRSSGEVSRFEQIGVIGESGSGTLGTHLHFAVQYQGVNVDPSGWEPDPQVYPDPWFVESGIKSYPMWTHSIHTSRNVPVQSGGVIHSQYYDVQITVPAGYYQTDLLFNLTQFPVSGSYGQLVSLGHSFSLNAFDLTGNSITHLDTPLPTTVRFSDDDLLGILSDTLSLYTWSGGSRKWEVIDSIVNLEEKYISASLSHLSIFALMGNSANSIFIPIVSR